MTGMPIRVISQPEPGTLGTALLAGQAVGSFDDLTEVSRAFVGTIRVYEPDKKRAGLHQQKLESYRGAVKNTLSTFHKVRQDST